MKMLFAAIGFLAAVASQADGAPVFALSSEPNQFRVGETVDVRLRTSDFPDRVLPIFGLSFDLEYDQQILAYETTLFDPRFDFAQDPQGAGDPPTGLIRNITASTLFSPIQETSVVLATLQFTALSIGQTTVALSGTAGALGVTDGEPVDEKLDARVNVIPLPASWIQLMAAIGMVLSVQLRLKRASLEPV